MVSIKFLCIFLLLWVQSSQLLIPVKNYKLVKTKLHNFRMKRSQDCYRVDVNVSNEVLPLCLHIIDNFSGITNNSTSIQLYRDNETLEYNLEQLNLDIVSGYVQEKKFGSSINGYLHNGSFYGTIYYKGKVFYVENALNYLNGSSPKQNAVLYEGNLENIYQYDMPYRKKLVKQSNFSNNIMEYRYYRNDAHFDIVHKMLLQKKKKDDWSDSNNGHNVIRSQAYRGFVCNLLVIIDASFMEIIAHNNVNAAISIALTSIDNANTIFRSTDFNEDGIPDNIGFQIKNIIIERQPGDFGISENINKYRSVPIDGRIYLMKLSKFPYMDAYCLGIAFTAQSFENRVIGLSYTGDSGDGGICQKTDNNNENHNCLAVTYSIESNLRTPQYMADLSLIHELGHSFGSSHDDDIGCKGFVMTSHTEYAHGLFFSDCSKRQIRDALKTRASCFQTVYEPFCGNGIVEHGESCDCGHPIQCNSADSCCTPRGLKKSQCSVNTYRGAQCHPAQGLCCMRNCNYRNMSKYNLNCKKIHKKCPCDTPRAFCTCGLRGICIENECHSLECVRIGLKECECSKPEDNKNICQTCCLIRDSCKTAHEATKMVLETNLEDVFYSLQELSLSDFDSYSANNDTLENVCYNSNCIKILFKTFRDGDFCLQQGALSTCFQGTCAKVSSMPRKNVFPRFQKAMSMVADNMVGKFGMAHVMLFLSCFVILF